MNIYDLVSELRIKKGISQSQLERDAGLGKGAITRWKTSNPNTDSLQKVASVLGCSVDYLMNGEESDNNTYYLNDDARDMAQFLFENPDYKVLFDATRKVKRENLEFVKRMIDMANGEQDDTGC